MAAVLEGLRHFLSVISYSLLKSLESQRSDVIHTLRYLSEIASIVASLTVGSASGATGSSIDEL